MPDILDLLKPEEKPEDQKPDAEAALPAEWRKFDNRRGPRFVHDAQTFEQFKEHKRLFAEVQEYAKRVLGDKYRPPDGH